jgi:hypothetical protein
VDGRLCRPFEMVYVSVLIWPSALGNGSDHAITVMSGSPSWPPYGAGPFSVVSIRRCYRCKPWASCGDGLTLATFCCRRAVVSALQQAVEPGNRVRMPIWSGRTRQASVAGRSRPGSLAPERKLSGSLRLMPVGVA